jgi:hypothetical protein
MRLRDSHVLFITNCIHLRNDTWQGNAAITHCKRRRWSTKHICEVAHSQWTYYRETVDLVPGQAEANSLVRLTDYPPEWFVKVRRYRGPFPANGAGPPRALETDGVWSVDAFWRSTVVQFKRMNLQVDLDMDREFLLAVVRGTVSFDSTWHVLKQICDTALQKNLTRILVDALGVQGVATTTDRYTIGVKLVTYCGEHKLWPRLAFVGQPPVVDGFGVLVAKNRGLAVERFPNWKEALEWVGAALSCTTLSCRITAYPSTLRPTSAALLLRCGQHVHLPS